MKPDNYIIVKCGTNSKEVMFSNLTRVEASNTVRKLNKAVPVNSNIVYEHMTMKQFDKLKG